MVQTLGVTYRIVEKRSLHEVVRVLDDRIIGVFRHTPTLEVVNSDVPHEHLLAIAQEARRAGRLAWAPARAAKQPWLLPLIHHTLSRLQNSFVGLKPLPFRTATREL